MKKLLVITGPTATGKTALGVALAQKLGGEVVSADSMQLYRHMDIGTAKPTPAEMGGIPHHMLDVASPFERYSVSRYVAEATQCVEDIFARGKVPILVGGTGLYIESLLAGRDFSGPEENPEGRAALERAYDALGGPALLERLARLDPERAAKLHPNDKKRIVRALEMAEGGETISAHDRRTNAAPPRYEGRLVVLSYAERERLYARIEARVEEMVARGLVEEVRGLLSMGLSAEHTAMQAIGYKEIAAHLRGECSLAEAVALVKRGSRRYAKRQLSWWGRHPEALRINWKNEPDLPAAVALSTSFAGA